MKKLFVLFVLLASSWASTALAWKSIANETVWPRGPYFRDIPVGNKETYSEIRVYVVSGAIRASRVMLMTEQNHQIPLWNLQGDYRSPRAVESRFNPTKLRSIRLELQSLEANRPSNIQIYIR